MASHIPEGHLDFRTFFWVNWSTGAPVRSRTVGPMRLAGCIVPSKNSSVQTSGEVLSGVKFMTTRKLTLLLVATTAIAFMVGAIVTSRIISVQAQVKPGYGIAALAGQRVGQDVDGPYDVDPNWPKPITALPGHEKWTYGAVESVYAENPNRVFILERGEIPNLKRPEEVPYPSVGPSISFPVAQVPWRNASVGPVTSAGNPVWSGKLGVDARWEHCIVVVDANGNIIEDWTKWDKMLRRPHFITINPYDPEKHVWVVDDQGHAVYEFTHDGKELVKTLGTPDQSGNDDKHFNRPTFINWLPDGNMFVTDRSDHRIEIFDENGKFLDQWTTGKPSTPQFLYKAADGFLWIADGSTAKIIKFDMDGHLLYEWGSAGDWPGALWNVHGMSVDQDGNLYLAEVNNGRAEKFRPRPGANPNLVVGKPIYSAWK